MFALALGDKYIQQQCKLSSDPLRMTKGVADYPFSLMQGIAGDVSFLSDIIRNDHVRVPGFEL
jgi:hypothetical protein